MTLCSYKYRLNPTEEQEILLNKHFGCVRFLYNQFLERRINSYQQEQKSLNYYDNATSIPELKQTYDWLKEVGSQALQYSARALQNGYDNFFRKVKLKAQGKHKGKCGFPRFKKKHGKQSFKVLQNIKVIDGKLSIPKFKDGIPIILHRPLEGEIEFATVSKNKAGQYFVSITTSRTITPLPQVEKTIGLDMNVHAIVGSDGTKYENPLPRTKYGNRLRFLKKAKNRTQKESKGRAKAWLKLNKLEQHIHNIREDFQHKVSRKIIDENQVIVVETLSVADMLRNADPEVRKIERWRERAYHRKQADACFSSFFQKLTYKAEGRAVCPDIRPVKDGLLVGTEARPFRVVGNSPHLFVYCSNGLFRSIMNPEMTRLLLKIIHWAQRKHIKVENLTREQIIAAASCKHS